MNRATRRFPPLLLSAVLLFASGCATAPFDYPRDSSVAVSAAEDSGLRQQVDQWREENVGPSGFYPLISGQDAFGARLRLIERAEKSIDVQYFLMKGDAAGQVFAGALLRAADRGVRVRFLLDDIFSTVKDEELELLDAHPNIEIRLFNPAARRGIGFLNFIADFKRANRRMHNKSFTVDNQITIVGGRNIADEYFGLRPEGEFLDLDVMGVGPVAADVSAIFDRFWNHERALPMEAFSSRFSEEDLATARSEVDAATKAVGETIYRQAVGSTLIRDFMEGNELLFSAEAEVITDEPDKLTTGISREHMILVQRLADVVSSAETEVIVFTPYFVPGDDGVAFWKSVVDKGVRVVIVTNSLASNNHTAVHSGYAGYRKRILEAGVELYEVRANAVQGEAGSLTLHTKGMIFDRSTTFVGSLNLDPRSIEINSEMGMLIPNEVMAEALAVGSLERLSEIAYRLQLNEQGKLRWHATIDGVEVIETSEPLASGFKKFSAFLQRIVPNSQL
jgi:putative cardiolipin synthase